MKPLGNRILSTSLFRKTWDSAQIVRDFHPFSERNSATWDNRAKNRQAGEHLMESVDIEPIISVMLPGGDVTGGVDLGGIYRRLFDFKQPTPNPV